MSTIMKSDTVLAKRLVNLVCFEHWHISVRDIIAKRKTKARAHMLANTQRSNDMHTAWKTTGNISFQNIVLPYFRLHLLSSLINFTEHPPRWNSVSSLGTFTQKNVSTFFCVLFSNPICRSSRFFWNRCHQRNFFFRSQLSI